MALSQSIYSLQIKSAGCCHRAVNTKHNICTIVDQRRRRLADVVQMLCKCFVFAGQTASCDISFHHNMSIIYSSVEFDYILLCKRLIIHEKGDIAEACYEQF